MRTHSPTSAAVRSGVLSSVLAVAVLALAACGDDLEPTERGTFKYGIRRDDPAAFRATGESEVAVPVAVSAPGGGALPPGAPVVMQAEPAGGAGGKARAPKYKVIEVKDGGKIVGVCKLSKAVEVAVLDTKKDAEKCGHGASMPSERLVYDKDTLGVKNCVVFLADIAEGKDFEGDMASDERTALLDQVGCVYVPHVRVVRTETQLVVKNSDPVQHNVHAYKNSELVNQFNFGTAPKATMSEVAEAFLEDAAKYIVKCDIHPWMSSTIHAVKHPYYAVTNDKGEYVLENVPPGTYRAVCWHEGMVGSPVQKDGEIIGYNYSKDVEVEKTATVEASKEVTVDFEIPSP